MQQKPNRFFSAKQEKRGNKKLGLSMVANSGATTFSKGDGKDKYLLMEWKTLTKPQRSRTIQKDWFEKNLEEAFAMRRQLSAVGFDFGDGEDYIAVDINTFAELYNAWKKQQEELE